jgi:hypothetical protein
MIDPLDAMVIISPIYPLLASAVYALTPNLCPDPRYPLRINSVLPPTYRTLTAAWIRANTQRLQAFFAALPPAEGTATRRADALAQALRRAERAVQPSAAGINFWVLLACMMAAGMVLQIITGFVRERYAPSYVCVCFPSICASLRAACALLSIFRL